MTQTSEKPRFACDKERMEAWKVQSDETPGFHPVITPDSAECQQARIYRLNLPAGQSYVLESGDLEMHPVLISGAAHLDGHPQLTDSLERFDAFYMPGHQSVTITADQDCVFYIAAAVDEGYGKPFVRHFDASLPIGDIHQIHGEGIGQREVMMTLSDKDDASRLICGLTWSNPGAWTSWPPHQHEKDLEEVYCYFDMPQPMFGFHISYLRSGQTDEIVAHSVHSGTMVQAPCGYHPTCASPAGRNAYLWVLASFSHPQRRYDLAILDPVFA